MAKVKVDKEKLKNTKVAKSLDEFKAFISRGNVVDMAVGVIIGAAFGKIIASLVDDILMPLIGTLLGGLNFSSLSIKVGEAKIAYGMFIQTVVDFLIIALCIFFMIKLFEKFKAKEAEEEPEVVKTDETLVLEEIRDILKKK